MNIFAVSKDTKECAKCLDDVRLNKMIIETGQLLSTATRQWNEPEQSKVYKERQPNHPVNIWVRNSLGNFGWTFALFSSLIQERRFRTGREHKSEELLVPFLNVVVRHGCLVHSPGEFQNSSYYKHLPVHQAYRETLLYKWLYEDKKPPTWIRRGPPDWYEG